MCFGGCGAERSVLERVKQKIRRSKNIQTPDLINLEFRSILTVGLLRFNSMMRKGQDSVSNPMKGPWQKFSFPSQRSS